MQFSGMFWLGWNKLRCIGCSAYYYLLALIYIIGASVFPVYSASATECSDVQFVFARGSGEELNGPSYQAWRSSIEQRMSQLTIGYNFYELGSESQDGHRYPATAVSGSSNGAINLIGAAISGGELFEFGKSVDEGTAELKTYVSSTLQRCPNTKFVLGGYSQGAMLISRTLGELDASKIIYVSTFGDPKLYLPEGKRQFLKKPEACYGRNLSDYRTNVADCYAYEGILGSYRPYQPDDYIDKIGTWCNEGDIMCSSKLSIDDHTAYVSKNLYDEAAAMIISKISKFFGIYATTAPNAMHEVAFLVDNTDSMRAEQRKYQNVLGDFAERIIKGGGRVALYEFGDLAAGVKTVKRCGFGCSTNDFRDQYKEIDARGGGDIPESTLSGLMTTMNSLEWTNGATKSIVLLTDAGYHDPDIDGITLDDVVKRSLEIDPVNVYVIDTGSRVESYQELVDRTNGDFIKSSSIDAFTNQILSRPVAKLKMMNYQASIGDTLEFNASDSYAENGSKLRFDWDLDGDGVFEQLNIGATVSQVYHYTFNNFIQVKVTDQNDKSATMSARVQISTSGPEDEIATIDIFSSQSMEDSSQIQFSTTGAKVLLATEDAVLGWINIASGKGNATIQRLEKDTQFSLIPYSENGTRGERYDFSLSANTTKGDDANSTNKSSATITKVANPTVLPKVPNAGVYTNDR